MMLTPDQKQMQDKIVKLTRIIEFTKMLFEATTIQFAAYSVMAKHEAAEDCREKLKTQVDIICDAKAEMIRTEHKLTRSLLG